MTGTSSPGNFILVQQVANIFLGEVNEVGVVHHIYLN